MPNFTGGKLEAIQLKMIGDFMLINKYKFYCRFSKQATLPPFKGSLIRGMLGRSLRLAACALRKNDCSSCLLAKRCVYSLAFEAPKGGDSSYKKSPTPPHPYVLEPPLALQKEYAEGEDFEIGLLLFGEMNNYLPYFVYAVENMGQDGIGTSREKGFSPFHVQKVTCQDQTIYDGKNKVLSDDVSPKSMQVVAGQAGGKGELRLDLVTPLRIKNFNALATELPFHLLVRAVLRRLSALYSVYGGGEPDLDYKGLVYRSQEVNLIKDNSRWMDWTRYSSRQGKTMQFGGIVGNVVYQGDIKEFLPLLEIVRLVHVGKQTVFGLGKVDYMFFEN